MPASPSPPRHLSGEPASAGAWLSACAAHLQQTKVVLLLAGSQVVNAIRRAVARPFGITVTSAPEASPMWRLQMVPSRVIISVTGRPQNGPKASCRSSRSLASNNG